LNHTKLRAPEGPRLHISFLIKQLAQSKFSQPKAQAWGALVLPLGEATGGHGFPGAGAAPGVVPPELPAFPLPGVDGFVVDDPAFGADPGEPFGVPGRVPHGDPLGELPGVFGVFGLIVEGCVVLPGVGVPGEVDPGIFGFGVVPGEAEPGVLGLCGAVCGVAVPAGGVAVPAGGVAGLAGGVAVPAGGVAGEPGVEVWPAVPEPPAGAAPPAGAV